MAFDGFWGNFKSALRWRRTVRFEDAPRIDADGLREVIAASDAWLSPRTVRGFDTEDFGFLPADEAAGLAAAVADFQRSAAKFVGDAVTSEQRHDAEDALFRIASILELDRFEDAEAFRLGKSIEAERDFPHELDADCRYRTNYAASGGRALRIMVYLPDFPDEEFLAVAHAARRRISALVFDLDTDCFPFISFRVKSELAELQELQAAGADE